MICNARNMLYQETLISDKVINWANVVRKVLNIQGIGYNDLVIKAFHRHVKDNALQIWNYSMTSSRESATCR